MYEYVYLLKKFIYLNFVSISIYENKIHTKNRTYGIHYM